MGAVMACANTLNDFYGVAQIAMLKLNAQTQTHGVHEG